MTTMLDAAIEYATKYRWAVFPVKQDKTPYTPHGCLDAKTDIGAIRSWWKKWPDANIGVATGEASELLVVDLDIDKDKGLDGFDELTRWQNEHKKDLPDTVMSITGRGGYHLFYHYNGSDISNRAGVLDGVDIRGEGGYVVVPPSVHQNGRAYEWEVSPEDIDPVDLDDTVIELVEEGKNNTADQFELPEVIPEGQRNQTLFRLAASLQSKGLANNAIRAALEETNKTNCVKPLAADELDKIVSSTAKYKKGQLTQKQKKKLRKLKTAQGLMERDIPEPEIIVGVDRELPFLVEGTCILSAKPKLGKSWFALALCLAIANGTEFLGYKTARKSVLYLDLETSESIQKKRLVKALKGRPVPDNLYIETETDTIENGLLPQLEDYIKQDPELGVIIIDVFQYVRSAAKNFKETEYDHAYRDIGPLNKLAQKYHISIILVCHDRKSVDPNDPFSNILGSTGLQGAVNQMIVMFRKRKTDLIHISVKGKTIDGLIDMNVQLDNAEWSIVEGGGVDENAQDEQEYQDSAIRQAVIEIIRHTNKWSGRCSWLVQEAVHYGVAVTEAPKKIGWFLRKHQGRFLKNDGIVLSIIDNGQGGKTYEFKRSTVDTVDKNGAPTVDGFESVSTAGITEIPFT